MNSNWFIKESIAKTIQFTCISLVFYLAVCFFIDHGLAAFIAFVLWGLFIAGFALLAVINYFLFTPETD